MTVLGLHQITLVCSDAQRTVDFYTRVLGQRFIKKTVNFDDPLSYHLYFGDELGRPGTAITFFEWRSAPRGYPGIGGTHHFALQVADYAGLLKWKRRLTDLGIEIEGPLDRFYFKSIYFRDPDGVILEIATQGPGWTMDEVADRIGAEYREPPREMVVRNRDEARIKAETWSEPVLEITPEMKLAHGMHHITAIGTDIARTHAFFGELLGMRRVKMTSNFDDPTSAHWYWGVGDGRPGTIITYFERDPRKERRAQMGAGQTHHFALAVPDAETQLEWREKLVRAGLPVSPVMDRIYFKSIYMRDPDGHIVELATAGPGFAVDEDAANLGTNLKLPPWLEKDRGEIEANLQPIIVPAWNALEPA
ncbi:Putative ring-cleaving dioxygenase MhqA [Anaerolineae bacterium]|nr:Putative ring-cleaving dioxygenase MhqA [Anaerolineae bacterium]